MKRVFFLIVLLMQLMGWHLAAETVVVIHGFRSTAKSMRTIQKTLSNMGYVAYMWEYPSQSKYLEDHGCDLLHTLRLIASDNPGKPIHFVVHSSGALVLRAALNQPDCPNEAKIGRAVLLTPPNQGSCLARCFRHCWPVEAIMGPKSGWQFIYLDPHQFRSFGEFPCTMDVLVVAGLKGSQIFFRKPNDGVLTVDETYLNTPFYFKTFFLSHGEVLTHRSSIRCIKAFLLCSDPDDALNY